MSASRLLDALADLAPPARAPDLDRLGERTAWSDRFDTVTGARTLEAQDELHRDERLLRQGWAVVIGHRTVDGKRRRIRFPLVTRPVRLRTEHRRADRQSVMPAGDCTVAPELDGTEHAGRLRDVMATEGAAAIGDTDWLAAAAEAAGFAGATVVDAPPRTAPDADAPVIVARPVIHIDRSLDATPIAQGLRDWARRDGIEDTALAAAYASGGPASEAEAEAPQVRCALPLSLEQSEAVAAARTEPVSVVAGAPGCGKSHTLAAIALDAVAAGRSVLITAQSVHAADVLAELLDRHPGPVPVQFGDSEGRDASATRLSSGVGKGHGRREVERHLRAASDAADYADRIEREITDLLDLERRRSRALETPQYILDRFPLLADADLDEVERVAAIADGEASRWWHRLRRRRAARRLPRMTGADNAPAALARAIEAVRDRRALARLAAEPTDLAPLWHALDDADRDADAAAGTALRVQTGAAERRSGPARRALASLATTMRQADRTSRRAMLAGVGAGPMLRAMPLWIGTVADADDLLPAQPGMFDLVILDEASHINQLRAAPVLARARRAVVAGDPRQLRFVSFAGEDRLTEVLDRHGLADRRDQLDTRRVSAYDLACGAGPIVQLTEHHRSVPHLIGFSARKFYRGKVAAATRHPRNHDTDAISVHQVSATKANTNGVLAAEVDRVLELLVELVGEGASGIAVLSPFRAQADAIEAAVLDRFELETIRDRRIRAGTVHAFQGSEAETVIASLGTGDGDSAGRRRFIANPNLFNVMVTRAREHLHVVTSLTDPGGLVGEFLAYADRPPREPLGSTPDESDDWSAKLAEVLTGSGVRVRRGYPVGHWRLDLVVGEGEDAVGVCTRVHPDGPDAHLQRHRALRRSGWRLIDVLPSAFDDDPSRAAVSLLSG